MTITQRDRDLIKKAIEMAAEIVAGDINGKYLNELANNISDAIEEEDAEDVRCSTCANCVRRNVFFYCSAYSDHNIDIHEYDARKKNGCEAYRRKEGR